jgi:hypothetical protein
MAVVDDPQRQLDWERKQRPRAAVAALLSAAVTLGADLLTGSSFGGAPRTTLTASIQQALKPGDVGHEPSLRVPFYEFFHDHVSSLIAGAVLRAIGLVALGWALTFLAAATRARRPELPKLAVPVALVGALLSAVSTLMGGIGSAVAVNDFLNGPRTVDAAADITKSTLLATSQFIGLAGQLALAVAFVLIGLNAMRAGLLSRFIGILGVIVGILTIFPIGPVQVVQPVWLLAVGLMFAGVWPGGVPPAWRTGRAEPWPSAQEQAERRRAARGGGRPEAKADTAPEPAAQATPGAARRKRKRRK